MKTVYSYPIQYEPVSGNTAPYGHYHTAVVPPSMIKALDEYFHELRQAHPELVSLGLMLTVEDIVNQGYDNQPIPE